MESLPILSRNPSRNTERDWENASTASSIASVAEYTGACFVLAFVSFVSFVTNTRSGKRVMCFMLFLKSCQCILLCLISLKVSHPSKIMRFFLFFSL